MTMLSTRFANIQGCAVTDRPVRAVDADNGLTKQCHRCGASMYWDGGLENWVHDRTGSLWCADRPHARLTAAGGKVDD